jgi:hypothetical protein
MFVDVRRVHPFPGDNGNMLPVPVLARIILKDGPTVLGWERWREIDEWYFGRSIPDAWKRARRAASSAVSLSSRSRGCSWPDHRSGRGLRGQQ